MPLSPAALAAADDRVQEILAYLQSIQLQDGEIPAVRRFADQPYPGISESEFPGWYHFGKCVFFTASVVYHLREIPGASSGDIRRRGCAFLLDLFEGSVIRYVPSRHQEIWFPADADDTVVVKAALALEGITPPGPDRMLLANRNWRGRFLTYFVPRFRHLIHPDDFGWLVRDLGQWGTRLWKQDWRNALRLAREYWSTQEPAIDANALLYFRNDPRVRGLAGMVVRAMQQKDVTIEYYDSLIVPYFHAARAYGEGVEALEPLRKPFLELVRERRASQGTFGSGFEAAMIAVALMRFGWWDSPLLDDAVRQLLDDPMHETGWQPAPYANSPNFSFSDGAPGFTAALFADALHRYARHWEPAAR
jgi:hypothetical protein